MLAGEMMHKKEKKILGWRGGWESYFNEVERGRDDGKHKTRERKGGWERNRG